MTDGFRRKNGEIILSQREKPSKSIQQNSKMNTTSHKEENKKDHMIKMLQKGLKEEHNNFNSKSIFNA